MSHRLYGVVVFFLILLIIVGATVDERGKVEIKDDDILIKALNDLQKEALDDIEAEITVTALAADSLPTRFVKGRQHHLNIPDESLAVDGDVVRSVYSQPDTDLPRFDVASSNTTINVNQTVDTAANATSFRCNCITGKENDAQPVEVVNSTRLLNILVTEPNVTNRKLAGECVVLFFYAPYCSFSALAAPHLNALSRAFKDLKMAAVDAMKFHSFNTQYGIVGVPTVVLFHNGRPVSKFNESEYTLELFAKFITKNTGIKPDNKLLYVMSSDFGGPISSVPTKETDYCLALSWIFIVLCGLYFFSKSAWWKWIVETVQNTWREAEAQHEHAE